MADTLASLIVKIGADISEYVDQLGKAQRQIGAMGAQLEQVGMRMSAAITLPMVALGGAALKTAGEFEQNRIAFTTMLGTADKAKSMLKDLSDLAAKSPFELKDTVAGARRLLAMGTAAKDVVPVMKTIGNAVSALGTGSVGLERVSLALGQMGAKGRASGEEMRQLTEGGIRAWDYLAKAIGKTVPEAMALVEKKAISSGTAIAAILDGINSNFAGAMEAQNQTFLGQVSNLKDNITRTLAEIGEVLMPAAKSFVSALQPMLDKAVEMAHEFAKLPQPVQNTALAITGLVAAAGPLLYITGALATSLSGVMKLLSLMGAGGGIVAGATTALVALGGAALAVGAAFAGWKLGTIVGENMNGIKEAIGGAIQSMTGITIKGLFGGGALSAEAKEMEANVARMAEKVKEYGVVVPRGTMSTQEWAAAIAAWVEKAQQAEAAGSKNTKALHEFGDALKEAEARLALVSQAQKYGANASDQLRAANIAVRDTFLKLHPEFAKSSVAFDSLTGKMKEFNVEALKQIVTLANYEAGIKGAKVRGIEFKDTILEISTSMPELADGLAKLDDPLAGMVTGMTEAQAAAIRLKDAFKLLGISSTDDLEKIRQKAVEAYETIAQSGKASARDLTIAQLAVMKATIESLEAQGVSVVELTKTYEKLKTEVGSIDGHVNAASKKMSHAMQQVSTIVTDLSKGIADAIVHFKGFGDVAKKIVQELASAIIRDLIEGALAKLGTKLTSIGGMWGKLGGILGGGSSGGGGAAGSAAGAAGGAGGSIGSIGSAAGNSASAIVGAVGSVVSAISGVIGNFQMAHMNTALGRIEENTRFTQIALIGPGGVLNRLNTFLPFLQGIEQRVMGIREALFDPIAHDLEGIYNRIGGGSGGGAAVVNNFYGVTDPREMAEKVVASMRLAGVRV